jgi:hypothetical protein
VGQNIARNRRELLGGRQPLAIFIKNNSVQIQEIWQPRGVQIQKRKVYKLQISVAFEKIQSILCVAANVPDRRRFGRVNVV